MNNKGWAIKVYERRKLVQTVLTGRDDLNGIFDWDN